jgi:hypothetical protein
MQAYEHAAFRSSRLKCAGKVAAMRRDDRRGDAGVRLRAAQLGRAWLCDLSPSHNEACKCNGGVCVTVFKTSSFLSTGQHERGESKPAGPAFR